MANWVLEDSGQHVAPSEVRQLLVDRVNEGRLWTHFRTDSGQALMFVSNGDRAMVVFLKHEGDAGEHAVDPGAAGESTGFVLDNGQVDTYSDRDTVPLMRAVKAVEQVLTAGHRPSDHWQDDR